LLLASNKLPRGVAEKKLRGLYSLESDAKVWSVTFATVLPTGWSREKLDALLGCLPGAFRWIEQSFGVRAGVTGIAKIEASSSNAAGAVSVPTKYVVFTGVRDKELQSVMGAKGWILLDAVTKQTNVVVIADGAEGVESGKTKKAKQLGIEIITISKFRERC
jgi:NAD-dependent DNA ligase